MNWLNSDDFWQFACDLYSKGDMQTRLLAYQNQQGKNVNLYLLLYYLDSLNLAISQNQLNKLEQSISEFDQQVLTPLRATRGYLKANQTEIADYAIIRKELLSTELKLEKQQQQMLITTINSFALTPCSAPNNTRLYL
ncbi:MULTISPECIES: TIGR02444 family protein [unclassified Pseudoalteromonas]|uniref:TIGR02444 family protein n=1 Tax=unclassified Pseudoalteromonas TaxID=194690 RepID=UPI000B3D416E|nr:MULTISPECIES: TIGR02444 family protein [unclassified Pseudoalteromonas]MDN3378487.1 TIGR02444 family protein [Pseudoalteromonas sp. APC 3893]MDN3387100.1 TIGR02444 family protein [Pseudoalteromonas sp. APC 4017]OUS71852.1 TIGR02444 family protein [Pseudoalteromonas sp. A601]